MKTKLLLFFFVFSASFAPVHGKINGYLSFEYIIGQGQSNISHGSFQNAQFGLIFSGVVTAKIDYISEVRFGQESSVELEQAWVRFKPSNSFILKLGLYLVPFGKYNQSNRPHQTMLIKNPLHIENMFPMFWRDIGILIEGKWGSFLYSAYLGNGLSEAEYLSSGQQFEDRNTDKGKGGRVGLALSREIEAGYSYFIGKYDDGNKRNLILQGLDFAWVSKAFQILSEYSAAHLENPKNYSSGKVEGYFILVSFDIDNIRPVVSFQWEKYKDPFHGHGFIRPDYGGVGIFEERTRWTLGFVYIASQNVFFKLEYDFNHEKDFELKDDTLLAQVALSF